jgi:Tfp pilus assembly protein PilV
MFFGKSRAHDPERSLTSTARSYQRRGVALLDVIVGGIVLAIGMTVVITLTSRSIAWQADGERRLVASWLADELLSMVVVEGPREYERIYDSNGRFEPPFDQFEFELDITELSVTDPYLVTATISWEQGRSTRSIQVQSFITERAGEEADRTPLEPIDRISRYYGVEDESATNK